MALFRYNATSNKLVPITSEGSVGIPVGAVMAFAEGTTHENWLLCDGRDTTGQADELATHYPALYTYLGNSNVLPTQFDHSKLSDYETITLPNRPFAAMTMDYDGILSTTFANTAGGGAFKFAIYVNGIAFTGGSGGSGPTGDTITVPFKKGDKVYYYSDGQSSYTSYVWYYKQPLYIKATSAGIEVDKDLYATKGMVRDAVSYSTTEQPTGGTWIDGKPIYRLVSVANRLLDGSDVQVAGVFSQAIADTVDTLIKFTAVGGRGAYPGQTDSAPMTATFNAWQSTSDNKNIYCNADNKIYSTSVIVEYTKTTD